MASKKICAAKTATVNQAARFLKKNDNYIILTHSSPDGDTLGSAFALYYALKKCGKHVSVLCPDAIPEKFNFFVTKTDSVPENPTVISVDVADKKLLGDLDAQYGERVELCIDHHVSNTSYAQMLLLDSDASATCEIVFKVIKALKTGIDDITAISLYTGIATDTGCFKYQNVTENTHRIAAELYRYNIGAANINKLMFDTKSRNVLLLERMVLDTAEYHFDNKCMLLSVTKEMQEKTGCKGSDLEGIAVISRSVEGVICGITLKQADDNTFKISMRTYAPLNASEICKKLGGGGHNAAAGATLTGTLDEVKAQVLGAVSDALGY